MHEKAAPKSSFVQSILVKQKKFVFVRDKLVDFVVDSNVKQYVAVI